LEIIIGKFLRFFVEHTYKKFIKKCHPLILKLNSLEEIYESLSDEAIIAKSEELKRRVVGGESLDHVLLEGFAPVKTRLAVRVGRKSKYVDRN
jgi:preprotein translocase subunit SecA